MIKLICDLNITLKGHNASHVQYVVDHISVKKGDRVYFLFNRSARNIIDLSNAALDISHFYFCDTDFEENSLYDKLKFRDWKVIEKYARQLKIDALFIMELTRYEVQIGRSNVPYKISGIEFRPSHRISSSNGKLSTRVKATTKKYKKRFLEAFMLRSKSLENIYILNDASGAESLNKIFHTGVFKHLVDPIYDYNGLDEAAAAKLPAVSKERVVFIIFGAISGRKNIRNILEGFGATDKSIHKHITLLIVGKIPGSYAGEFRSLTQQFVSQNPDIELVIVDDFVSDSQMEYYFSKSDVSLMIYANFYGSSGLLGRAAKYNLISLVPNVGLMAEICDQYKLGYLCDPNSPPDIGDKLGKAYDDIVQNKLVDGTAFYKSHSPEAFLQALNF